MVNFAALAEEGLGCVEKCMVIAAESSLSASKVVELLGEWKRSPDCESPVSCGETMAGVFVWTCVGLAAIARKTLGVLRGDRREVLVVVACVVFFSYFHSLFIARAERRMTGSGRGSRRSVRCRLSLPWRRRQSPMRAFARPAPLAAQRSPFIP